MFYLVNKHKGITSFGALSMLRKKLGVKKIGHTGTLDPLATGLLLVATGNSTKLIPYLEKKAKTYEFTFNLDGISPTGDLEGEIVRFDDNVLAKGKKDIDAAKIKSLIKERFIGVQKQTPPRYSAIKIGGKKAYELARSGKEFEMKEREIEIFGGRLISFDFPEVRIEMTVSAGAYIRTIAEDIGKGLGLGGYITYLHRTRIGSIDESLSKHIEQIEENDSLSEEVLFPEFSKIEVDDMELEDILHGREINKPGLTDMKKYLITHNGKSKSLAEARDGRLIVLRNGL